MTFSEDFMRRTVAPIAALLCAAAFAGTVQADTFRAENRVYVTPVPGGFEVQSGGGFGARGMWCAAADYARTVLGARGQDRIYIAKGRTPGFGQRDPVLFTLDPRGLVPSPVFIVGASLRRAGATLSVDHAYGFCPDARVINR